MRHLDKTININYSFLKKKDLTVYEKVTYMFLAMNIGQEASHLVDQRELAEQTGISVVTLRKALRGLKEKGYIDFEFEPLYQKGQGYRYRVIKYAYYLGDHAGGVIMQPYEDVEYEYELDDKGSIKVIIKE